MKTLTYRPFSSLSGRLVQDEAVTTVTELLNEHAAGDADVVKQKAAEQAQLTEAYQRRLTEAAELRGATVPTALSTLIESAISKFGVPGYTVTGVKSRDAQVEVVVESKSGERRTLTISIK